MKKSDHIKNSILVKLKIVSSLLRLISKNSFGDGLRISEPPIFWEKIPISEIFGKHSALCMFGTTIINYAENIRRYRPISSCANSSNERATKRTCIKIISIEYSTLRYIAVYSIIPQSIYIVCSYLIL